MKKILLGLVPFFLFGFLLLFESPVLHWLELKSIDWRFHLREPLKPTSQIAIVTIDEKSLHAEGRWPWPREKIARLISQINALNPKLIGLDIIFSEPSAGDTVLKESIAEKKNVVLSYYFYNNTQELEKAAVSPESMQKNFEVIKPMALPQILGLETKLFEMSGVVTNLPELAAVARAQGYFNTLPDQDGVIRKAPLFLTYKGKSFPSLTLELFSHAHDDFAPMPILDEEGFLRGINLGTSFIPTDEKGGVWINYTGNDLNYSLLSATDILNGQVPKEEVEGKTILVGATAVGIYDLRVTPLSPVTPGILVQANLLDTLNRQFFLRYDLLTKFISVGVMFLMTLLVVFFLSKGRLIFSLLYTVLLIAGYGYFVLWMFQRGFVLSLVTPSLDAVTVAFALMTYRGLTEEKEKRKIRKAFQSYLHPDVINEIIKDPTKLKLGGQRANCSILFSDVRNFTTISEKMDPVVLVDLMNDYFDPVSKDILKLGGYIDKFIGDAVMVVFGIPKETDDHARQACLAGLAIQRRAAELEPVFRKKYGIDAFKIGVGIHTGPVIVGNIGTKERLNYTVMGDSVNLASRLESSTKALGVTILISEKTQSYIKDELKNQFVDEISVKGKEEKIRVYSLTEN